MGICTYKSYIKCQPFSFWILHVVDTLTNSEYSDEMPHNLIKQQFIRVSGGGGCSGLEYVMCSTRDRGAAGSSLTGVTALCP